MNSTDSAQATLLPYTASVIGVGTGGKASLAAIEDSERFQLQAFADTNETTLAEVKKLYPSARAFTSVEEMLQTHPTDVTCISTWPPSHKTMTDLVLRSNPRGILVEKPLAHKWQDAKTLLDQVKVKRLPIAVPHGLLVSPHAVEICNRVKKGDIGTVQLVSIECTQWDIMSAGIHWLNFICHLLPNEQFLSVWSQCDTSTKTFRDGVQVETSAATYIQSSSGLRIIMQTGDEIKTSVTGEGTVLRLIGTKGSIEFYGWPSRYRIAFFNPEGKSDYPHDVEILPNTFSKHQVHLERLAQEIDTGSTQYDIADSSLSALELCEAAYLSHRFRCEVTLPINTFSPPETNNWNPGEAYNNTGEGRNGRNLPGMN